jgi:predicted site-specific integrase-resolvase
VPGEQTATGTILVKPASISSGEVALYARVSSSDEKNELDCEVARLVSFANSWGPCRPADGL